jgi:hypothetical protein
MKTFQHLIFLILLLSIATVENNCLIYTRKSMNAFTGGIFPETQKISSTTTKTTTTTAKAKTTTTKPKTTTTTTKQIRKIRATRGAIGI